MQISNTIYYQNLTNRLRNSNHVKFYENGFSFINSELALSFKRISKNNYHCDCIFENILFQYKYKSLQESVVAIERMLERYL